MNPEDFDALAGSEDYRSIAPLTAMVLDATLPESVRIRASEVVTGFDDTTTAEQRRTWWASADLVVMRHALGLMDRTEADIVIAVASDDEHPLQATAVESMSFGFGEAEFMPVLQRALGHRDPAVREAAAGTLLWEEPVAAESALLAATRDETFEVAAAAINTLRYYPTRRVLREISLLRAHPDQRIAAAASDAFDEVQWSFEQAATEGKAGSVALLREWMSPIRDLVTWPEEITGRELLPLHTHRPRGTVPETELTRLLDDPDADRAELEGTLRGADWQGYEADARARASTRFATHPNPLVREIGCAALADWVCTAELVRLVGDRSFGVRKTAMYFLSTIPADPEVAEVAWQYLVTATGTTAQEAVRTYVVHAGPAAVDRLVELARSDRREAVRYEAICALSKLEAAEQISALADLLSAAPGVNWSVHLALLWALRELGLAVVVPPQLAAVDNVDLQSALAALTARQS
ncbi:HEAT repeat domain-containing protein [Nocardia sp. NPDC059240]|uniref:HEAT repeat domain-containing protein n=1 Tax=Nocardia sp. NPDC059240 TaxID=3346786 RepID=UPI0036BD57E1